MDNLNPKLDLVSLWGIFKPFGMVRDMFLSSKNSSRRSCFAFVRFASMAKITRVVEMMDGMFIYGWKISSKVAKYGWSSRRSSGLSGCSSKLHDKGDRVDKRGYNFRESQQHARSFAEAVRGDLKKETDRTKDVERETNTIVQAQTRFSET